MAVALPGMAALGVGAGILAVVGAVKAAGLVSDAIGGVVELVGGAGRAIGEAVGGAAEAAVGAGRAIGEAVGGATEAAIGASQAIGEAVGGASRVVSEVATTVTGESIQKDDCEEKLSDCENRNRCLQLENKNCEIEKAICKARVKRLESAKEKSNVFLLKLSISLRLVKETLIRITYDFADEEKVEIYTKEIDELGVEFELEEELKAVSNELMAVTNIMKVAKLKVYEYKESRKKEKIKLENSVVSLTEEKKKINSLLKIALVEMDAAEMSLSRLNENIEQKRAAILQIVESGLQSVGFGSGENSLESSRTKVDTSGDSRECEEEVESLASTVERIMKNLNLKITQLRRSLEDSRSNNEHLQSLTKKQAQDIVENMLYIKELEDRERMLGQNVEGLMVKIKEAEAEVARWREACELEIESGKHEIEQRDIVVAILTQELEKTKTDLDISNRKLNKKEELAAAAQATAEMSLQLADSTVTRLRERAEELSKQLEEAESRYRNRYKLRHICWPWQTLKLSTATMNNRVKNVKRMLSRCKKDAVKVNSATMNNKVKNVRRMLSNCKPWRALKLNTTTMNNRVKNVKRMLSN
ncbi:hypothetical protein FEM48_Zijuj03G0159100 [Ziziphus jujuba var. spinosa]|uniref:Uncharacterized protein n=1 Tax=Ziziphus jujuba var. spinosa TaxID=714518 RepID=A0A978VR85_ZIZJJ|nr:hypothetical protein FEM48_Zijuj03G0159100 [Ziziphus jujuba var. spinosa]